jgi:hypothetical protein
LRFEESNPDNTRFTVIVNGTSCGQLSMTTEEAAGFRKMAELGCSQSQYNFECSGDLYVPENWIVWHKRSGIDRRSGKDRRGGKDRRSSAAHKSD